MSKQKPAFNGISIAYKYRKDLETRLNTPENPVEEASKQFVDSPLTGVTNLASTISNTIEILDGKEGNRPFLGKQPIRLTDTTSEPSSTKTKQQVVSNPDERLIKAIIDESNKPFGFEINQAPYKDKQTLPIGNMTKGEQSFYASLNDFYTEKNKPLFQKAVERVYQGISEPTKKILRGVQSDDNLLEKSADIGLGVIGSALGTIMSPMNFFSPAGEDIGEQVGKVTTPEFGKKVGEFLPFLAMPNPIAFYGASVGSEFATNEAMKIVNNTNLSDENKQRMLEGIGLGSFVATHRALGKGIKSITKDRLKTEVDRLSNNIDKQVLESMNPKLQGEKQIDIRNDKVTEQVIKEPKNVTQEPKLGNVAKIQKPVERRTDKSGKEYYYNTETKKRTSKEEFEKQKAIETKVETQSIDFQNKSVLQIQAELSNREAGQQHRLKELAKDDLSTEAKERGLTEQEYRNLLQRNYEDNIEPIRNLKEYISSEEFNKKKISEKESVSKINFEDKSTPTEKVETKVETSPQYFEYTRPTESSNRMKVPIEGKVTSFEHKGREIITYKEEGGKEWKVTDAKTGFSLSDGQTFKTQKGAVEYAKERIDKAPKKLLDEMYAKAEKTSSDAEWYKPEQPKPTETIKTETKVEGKIEDAVKPQESTIERLKREALDEFKNNQTTNAGFNPLAYKNQIKYGSALLKEGAVKFADWSQRMIKDLGEKIKPQLLRIWSEIKKFGEDLGKIAVDKIGDFVESKYNPARPMKVMEGKILDKDNPLIQKMNEKVSPDSPIAKQTGKTEITKADENKRTLRTAKYYQDLISEKLPQLEKSEQKEILKDVVKEENQPIKYGIFRPANLGKEKNPLIQGIYQTLFERREEFKKDFDGFMQTINKLIREARQSRGFELIRQDNKVIDFLEGKTSFKDLTPKEQALATHLKQWFKEVEPVMTNKNAREFYVTHVKRGFLETWKQDGFWEAGKNLFKEQDKEWESQVLADIDLMIAKQKFNPFAITRKAKMPYSKDLGKILETYGKIFFLKKHFDAVRQPINIVNNLLGGEGRIAEKNFLKRYLKKMTGENIDNITPPALKKFGSGLMKYTGLRFLAWNLPAGILNTAAGVVDNFINIPMKEYRTGIGRFETRQGQRLIKSQNVVDVENLDGAIGLRQQLGKAIDVALFLPMRGYGVIPWGEHFIQGSFYLGKLTKEEFKTGKISPERHRQILEQIGNIHGAYRDNLAPDAKQYGGFREALQFKLWMFAKMRNRWERYSGLSKDVVNKFRNGQEINKENLRSAAKELSLIGATLLIMNDDDNPLRQPLEDIMSDLYGAFNPRGLSQTLRRGIPAVGTLVDLYDLIDSFMTQEKYKTSNKKYGIEKGDLKAEKKLERLLPLYRQYMKQVPENIQETKPKKLL